MSDVLVITPFVRKGSHVIVVMYGPSGCGKTLSALLMAGGLADGGKIGFIDTENSRGQVYAREEGVPPDVLYGQLTPPFTPERYGEAIQQMEKLGCTVLIIDSGSHLWEGIGGVLEMAEATGKEGLVKWAQPKIRYKKYVKTLLNSKMHLIICLRAKEKLAQEDIRDPETGRVKKSIVSKGMQPIQEKSFIFEATVQLAMPGYSDETRGTYRIEKCPRALLPAFPAEKRISSRTGELIRMWVDSGEPVDHDGDDLRRQAEAVASHGKKAFTEWWNGPGKPHRDKIKPYLENLQSIAKTADDEKAQAQAQASEPGTVQAQGKDEFGLPSQERWET